jgi:RimJ/RimL family protein N-acetyltransferase
MLGIGDPWVGSSVAVRPATSQDSRAVFEWRNDEQTRAASVAVESVEWSEHEAWFSAALASDLRYVYIAERRAADDSIAKVGMCRFDVAANGESAETSINLNPAFRGQGLAGEVLQASIEQFHSDIRSPLPLTATIRPANIGSIHIFLAAGFTETGSAAGFNHYVG